ncbi:MAG: HAD family phosphatase [Syntrophobacterales bacterium]|jgi:HAD superfamily hydrolase (TIGR01509 family)
MDKGTKLEAVLFDMDGVIVDSEPLWSEAEKQLLARRNLRYSPSLKSAMMGRDARGAVGCLIEHYDLAETVGELMEERNQLIAEFFKEHLKAIPGALELVRSVEAGGIMTGLVSSSPKPLVELALEKLSVTVLFDLILSGDQVVRGKPAPDIYITAAENLGVKPEYCLVIEDAPHGVAAAKGAGMCCLAISTSVSGEELALADKVVSGFEEVNVQLLRDLMGVSPKIFL